MGETSNYSTQGIKMIIIVICFPDTYMSPMGAINRLQHDRPALGTPASTEIITVGTGANEAQCFVAMDYLLQFEARSILNRRPMNVGHG